VLNPYWIERYGRVALTGNRFNLKTTRLILGKYL